jgi:FAD/FMN-containing dehydrogenase
MGKPTIAQLREQVRGDVVTPDDAGYEDARKVYNAMIDRRPGVVIRPANVEDVIAAVNFARESGLDLAVRGGGHSVPGFGTVDDGVVIDLSRMRGVRVDPENQRAHAEGGATWGDFNAATHEFGLATTGGIVSTTGVGGLTLGGGIGYLARGSGLSCDNLVSAEIVTADGRVLMPARTRTRTCSGRSEVAAAISAWRPRWSSAPGEGHLRRPDVLRPEGRRCRAAVLP